MITQGIESILSFFQENTIFVFISMHAWIQWKEASKSHAPGELGRKCNILESGFAAMLTVSNDEFWEDVTPVEFGSLPRLQDAVTVVGYPIGGDTISVTSGVVSRIEVTSYVHGATELLGVQASFSCTVYSQIGNLQRIFDDFKTGW